jgi:glycosyltransferase involved in cell wall biosynthesis
MTPDDSPDRRDGPLVSIVTATRNRAALLEWTMRSIRRQTYHRIEHIVMDGASDDGTVELLRRYEDSYGLRWKSAPDAGMYHAINSGLRLARGEILAYLNSDDLYLPWTVELVVKAFQQNPSADFVFGDALAIDEASGRQTLYWMPPFDLDFIRRSGFLAQPTVFWRRRVFDEEGGFDESLRYVADCDYWMRMGDHRTFQKISEFLAIERNHTDTLRAATGNEVWSELDRVRSRYVSLSGEDHDRRVQAQMRRSYIWWRFYSLGLLLQSLVPRRLRRGPWSRTLGQSTTKVSRLRLLVRALPFVKRIPAVHDYAARDVLGSGRSLLEPR